MKKEHKIILGILAVVAIVALYMWWKKKKEDKAEFKDNTENEKQPTPREGSVMGLFPLKFGSEGPEVKALQTWLFRNEGAQLKLDGIWGKETDAVVKRILKVSEITEDKYKKLMK